MIDTSDLEIIYNGEAGQDEFGITFPYASSDDIKVYIAGSDIPLAASEYSITNNKVVLSTPLEEAATVRITRETPLTQETQYINQGTTDLTRIEHSFDKLTMIAQENHNSMATVDSRVNSNMSAIASSTADLAAGNVSANLSSFVDEAGSASSAIAGYVADINSISSAISSDVIVVGGYVSTVNSASSYISDASSSINEMSGGISIMSGGISEISGNISGMSGGVSVMSSGIMDVSAYVSSTAESFVIMSAGNGIALSGGVVSAKVDSSTIGFDSNGALSCSVSGSAIPYVGSNGIDVDGTVISAKLDGSTISTNAAGELQCLVSGGGQVYSAGDGIVISDGGISIASTALQDVPQIISSGIVVRGGSDGSGGYFFVTESGATMGMSGGYRISCGDTVNIKTTDNAIINLSRQTVRLYANSRLSISCATTATQIQAGGASNTYLLVSSGNYVYIKHSTDTSRQIAVHMGMSATSDTPGIVRPDNSTCEVASGGIMSVKMPEYLSPLYLSATSDGYQAGINIDSNTLAVNSDNELTCIVSGGGGGITGSNGLVVSGGAVSPTSGLIFEMPTQSNVYSSGNKTVKTKLETYPAQFKLENNLSAAATSVYMLIYLNQYNHFQVRCTSSGNYDIGPNNNNFSKGAAKLEYAEDSYICYVGSGDYDKESHERTIAQQYKDLFGISAISGSSGTVLTETKCDIRAGGMKISAGDYALMITNSGIFASSGGVSSTIFQ